MSDLISMEHIGLSARDPEALKAWYEKVLDAKVALVLSERPPAFLMNLGGALVEIYSADSASDLTRDNKLAGWRHIALKTDSIERTKTELEGRGVQFREPIKPAGGGGRVLFFNDLEGNLFHLVERPPDWRQTRIKEA